MTDYHRQRVISIDDAGAIALADEVNVVYGSTATLLTKPARDVKLLVMRADKGSFRVRTGAAAGPVALAMPAAVDPTASISNGSGGWKISEGQELVLPVPDYITVKGYAGTDALSYFWV